MKVTTTTTTSTAAITITTTPPLPAMSVFKLLSLFIIYYCVYQSGLYEKVKII